MITQSKQRVFLPLMLIGLLFAGAVSAQADENRGGDRIARGAAVGAAVGTFLQIAGGRTAGHQLLRGALIGGTLGAAVGTYDTGYYGRDGYYVRDGYYGNGVVYRDRDSRDRDYRERAYENRDRDDRYRRSDRDRDRDRDDRYGRRDDSRRH